jgi:FkbM family methyltransferase
MSVLHKIWTNCADIPAFGFQFLWRHSSFLTGATITKVRLPGVGDIYLRADQSDASAVRQVFRYREYDTERFHSVEARILRRYSELLALGRTPTIVDAGANIGAAALWFDKKYDKAAVVAIEPEPGNSIVLRENVKNNSRISVIEAAIGSESGYVSVKTEGHGWSATTVRATDGIRVITMDDAFRSVKNGAPFIAKIDIEGFESDLFSKNIQWLDDVYVVFIEPHDWKFPGKMKSRSFQRAMALHDFELYISAENLVYVRT